MQKAPPKVQIREVIKEVVVEKIIYETVVKPEPYEVPRIVQVPVPTDAKDFPRMADLHIDNKTSFTKTPAPVITDIENISVRGAQ